MTNYVKVQKQCIKKKLKMCKKTILANIHNVQHASAEDHHLDQVKFSYRFT